MSNFNSKQVTPVSADSLPLPSGAATAAKQDTGNISLANINSKLNTLGQNTSANSMPVTMASDQSNMPMYFPGNTANLDAFGRLRVSEPQSLTDNTFQYDVQPLSWNSTVAGAAAVTHNSNKSSVDLIIGTASGDSTIFQSNLYYRYHCGKSQSILLTGNLGGNKVNCRRRIGQFDSNNGVFFELDGTVKNVVVRTSTSGSPVDIAVSQSSWDIDKLDGTGSSGVTLDLSLQQVFFIDYQWLGSGRIRFGFNIGGLLLYVHQFTFSNTIALPWSNTATLPLRVENVNTGTTASNTTAHLTCATIYSEGGYAPEGVERTMNNGATAKTIAAGTKVPVLSIRKTTAGIHVPIRINGVGAFCDTTDDLLIVVTSNPTLTGATFATTIGFSQSDTAATAMSGGIDIYSFYLRGTGAGDVQFFEENFFEVSNLILGATIGGVSDILTISATSLTGTASARAVISFREIY